MDNGACSYRRFLDGDESAFNDIMEQLFCKLVFFIDSYVHDIHAAEDIAIDTFSDLIVHKHRYNFKVTLKTYLYMISCLLLFSAYCLAHFQAKVNSTLL